MIYDLSNTSDLRAFKFRSNYFIENNKKVDLKESKNSRTSLQNAALHKFFTIIAEQLNELGLEFNFTGVKGYDLSTRYTANIVKEFFWKPIQITLFDYESTTKLNTQQMNEIIDIIIKFFADKGVLIEFPNKEHLK